MKTEIAIIKDGKVFRVEALHFVNVSNGNRAMNVDFDILSVDGEMYLAKHVLEMARTGERVPAHRL
jgi:hypothetical protein